MNTIIKAMQRGDWFAVAVLGDVVAIFQGEQNAADYANSIRDAIGEARGLTSAVAVGKVLPISKENPMEPIGQEG